MSQILGQKTMPWGNEKLGTSKYYIWAKGCTITEIAECIGTTPDVVNQRLNALPADDKGNTGFAKDRDGENDLVYWARIQEAFPDITVNRVWIYNNDDVLAQLAAGHKVIVEVPADPIGNLGGKHFVRYIGDHKLHDPWTASERPTSDFPNPTGYAVISGTWVKPEDKPAEAPKSDSVPAKTHQGLDLNNEASVKAAIDTWADVKNGVYVKADVYINFVNRICEALGIARTDDVATIINHVITLKEDFKKQVLVSTGLPAAEQIEGQGAPITPAAPVVTLINLPPHEKNALLGQLENAAAEIKKLLGL